MKKNNTFAADRKVKKGVFSTLSSSNSSW